MRTIAAKVSKELYRKVKSIAEQNGITVSEAIKQAIAKARIEDPAPKEKAVREIARIGNNINQIARKVNSVRAVDIAVLIELRAIEKELAKLLTEIRKW